MNNQTPKAAGCLIRRGHEVLVFEKSSGQYSLPCGKVEPGESPADAAIRETKEETGYVVQITGAPFVGFDLCDKRQVWTFPAEVVEAGVAVTPGEGTAMWGSHRALVIGRYGHYNERMLRALGIDPHPLHGKFHSHIIVADAWKAQAVIGGKVTIIQEGSGLDQMLTHHHLTGSLEDESDIRLKVDMLVKKLAASGIQAKRAKLEYEPLYDVSLRACAERAFREPYTEIHIKLLVAPSELAKICALATTLGLLPSRNIRETRPDGVVQFVSKQIHEATTMEYVLSEIDRTTNTLGDVTRVLEAKVETVRATWDYTGDAVCEE